MFELVTFDKTLNQETNGLICPDPNHLKLLLKERYNYPNDLINLVMVSGGFDPITFAHVRYLQTASKLLIPGKETKLVIVANKDTWLIRKKGYAFMPENERMEILSSINGVDFVTSWDDGSKDVTGCIEILRPTIFANGGDRSSIENVPEYLICKSIECKMYFGVGGNNKLQSSSFLVKNLLEKIKN